jgi:hypothetical protein
MGETPRFGPSALSNILYNNPSFTQAVASTLPPAQIIACRVKKIILDDSDKELFKKFGEWNSIGTIFWEEIETPYPKDGYSENFWAQPIFPNIKHYPLLNEIVYVIQLTDTNATTDLSSNRFYYFPPLNIWNSTTHNALPAYDNDPNNDEKQKVDYTSSFQGQIRRVTDNSTEINLGSTFVERTSSIYPLLPFEGDIIHEGRWGNSIRFGSTTKNSTIKNEWSEEGNNGDPITIVTNGQGEYKEPSGKILDPWIPVTERINTATSSLYLTSTQKIPINPISELNDSYAKSEPPEDVRDYLKPQIILNSGRLIFNAKEDAIILSSNKTIHLSTEGSTNIDSGTYIALTSPKVYLGSNEGPEYDSESPSEGDVILQSLVLGEKLHELLKQLSTWLTSDMYTSFLKAVDSKGVPIASLTLQASKNKKLGETIKEYIDNRTLLSDKVKTVK